MSSVKILEPKKFVREHTARFWNGNPSPGIEQINSAILAQLTSDGCREVRVCTYREWQVICCEMEWAEAVCSQFGSVDRVFREAVGLPGEAAGGLRTEWLVAALARAIRVWVDGVLVYTQGRPESLQDADLLCNFEGRVCVAYCLPQESDETLVDA